MFDHERMKQTICNLFTNAIKFSPKNSIIKTYWTISKDGLSLSVEDAGIGMSLKQLNSIFDATIVTSTYGTDGESGTGYGLPLVAKIISYHGGEVNVESTEDLGTTFTISLPLN